MREGQREREREGERERGREGEKDGENAIAVAEKARVEMGACLVNKSCLIKKWWVIWSCLGQRCQGSDLHYSTKHEYAIFSYNYK